MAEGSIETHGGAFRVADRGQRTAKGGTTTGAFTRLAAVFKRRWTTSGRSSGSVRSRGNGREYGQRVHSPRAKDLE